MAQFEVPEPRISSPTDVIVEMRRMGVCGSDVHYFAEGKIGTDIVDYPWTVGHEGAGVVTQVGSAVERVRPGDRVAIDPAMPCWTCDQCLAGRPHTCRNLRFLGCPRQAEGCLVEQIVLPETSCYPISEGLSFEEAALVEPLSIAVYAAQLAGDLSGAMVGVLGAGPIGVCTLLAAKSAGAERLFVTDLIDDRLAATEWIADWAGNPGTTDVISEIACGEPAQLDIIFECCGRQAALDQAIQLLRPGGRLLIIGIPETNRISFDINLLRRKEIAIQNVRRQNDCTQRALDLLESKEIDVKPMVTHCFDFQDAQDAFDLVAGYRDGVVKAMLTFD